MDGLTISGSGSGSSKHLKNKTRGTLKFSTLKENSGPDL